MHPTPPPDPYSNPGKEAAIFYGLFLKGKKVDEIRRDIDFPERDFQALLAETDEPAFRRQTERVYGYRKRILAIFDQLVRQQERPA